MCADPCAQKSDVKKFEFYFHEVCVFFTQWNNEPRAIIVLWFNPVELVAARKAWPRSGPLALAQGSEFAQL